MASEVRGEYEAIRREREGERRAEVLPLAEARAARPTVDWTRPVPVPAFTGIRAFPDWALADLRPRIDWTPFFRTWELPGTYPALLDDPAHGAVARDLFRDAEALLDELARDGSLRPRGVIGFWPADATDDDIALYADPQRTERVATLFTLRQQTGREGRANRALADYVAPRREGITDYVGAFAVTAGHGLDALVASAKAGHDDYRAILLAALADRLAEAFAERMHERVRREFWGYAAAESLENAALIREEYQGIRPAPGYPACPDHTEKDTLFRLLDAERQAGITLTESFAMLPASSVSGWYFWRPEARYFGVGRIGRDQRDDYARRKGWDAATANRWLAPILAPGEE
jgi:5-methyltetrahydrofolate--homocysteine methyltransferase